MEECVYKVAIIGDIGVGKTAALARFVHGRFISDTRPTLGVDFSLKHLTFNLDDTGHVTEVTLQIWDIAGEQRFRELIPYYITGVKGIILAFDSTSMRTLESLHEWINVIKSFIDPHTIPLILISTKNDLESSTDTSILSKFMNIHKIKEYFETSSVTGKNIEAVFRKIGILILSSIQN
ncbi:MAG: Rab family GTPase [Candidatus Hodarchaeales archaeon]|jgi:small GTP-binding protein